MGRAAHAPGRQRVRHQEGEAMAHRTIPNASYAATAASAAKVKINEAHVGLDTGLNRASQKFVMRADNAQEKHDVSVSSKDKQRRWTGKIDPVMNSKGWCIARVTYTGDPQTDDSFSAFTGLEDLDITVTN